MPAQYLMREAHSTATELQISDLGSAFRNATSLVLAVIVGVLEKATTRSLTMHCLRWRRNISGGDAAAAAHVTRDCDIAGEGEKRFLRISSVPGVWPSMRVTATHSTEPCSSSLIPSEKHADFRRYRGYVGSRGSRLRRLSVSSRESQPARRSLILRDYALLHRLIVPTP